MMATRILNWMGKPASCSFLGSRSCVVIGFLLCNDDQKILTTERDLPARAYLLTNRHVQRRRTRIQRGWQIRLRDGFPHKKRNERNICRSHVSFGDHRIMRRQLDLFRQRKVAARNHVRCTADRLCGFCRRDSLGFGAGENDARPGLQRFGKADRSVAERQQKNSDM